MAFNSWMWDLLGWVALPIVAVLLLILVFRHLVSEFPLFFSYLVATEVVGIVRLASYSGPAQTYLYVYWISDIIYTCFALVATYELFIKRLFPGFYKVRFYRYIFLVGALLVTGCATVLALLSGRLKLLVATIYVYSFVRAAILIFFVVLMLIMGRRWAKLEFAIAFGLGLDVSTSVASLGIWSHTPSATLLINRISEVAYDIACVIWLYCFWTAPKAQSATRSPALSAEAVHEAKKWQGSLKDFMSQ
ncbi:MAG TPA: hypothetical protein VLA83_08025, partial [Candidatus Binatia bacterium]|nr:hypothetical protein [Candidatus Binatia bacterium]